MKTLLSEVLGSMREVITKWRKFHCGGLHNVSKLSCLFTPQNICESGGIASLILNFGTRCKSLARFTPRPSLSRGNGSRYPWNRKQSGFLGRSGQETNRLLLTGIEPCLCGCLVIVPTDASFLSFTVV